MSENIESVESKEPAIRWLGKDDVIGTILRYGDKTMGLVHQADADIPGDGPYRWRAYLIEIPDGPDGCASGWSDTFEDGKAAVVRELKRYDFRPDGL